MDELRENLLKIEDINTYLDTLYEIRNQITIVISVRDTPGSCMPEIILSKLRKLGFSKFSKELWRMYTGIVHQGTSVLDYVSNKAEEKIEVDVELENLPIHLISAPWRNGNRASIVINNIDYACNRRGVNIVIYDIKSNTPIDSIYYDSHEKYSHFSRGKKILDKKKWLDSHLIYDICVVGFWYGANYGSLLNGYATYRILKDLGKSVIMLRKPDHITDDMELRDWTHNTKFVNSVYPETDLSPRMSRNDIKLMNQHVNTFLAGSDQIWNYNVSFSGYMYLPFVSNQKRRVSFCTSFGHKNDNVPNDRVEFVKSEFHKYDAISVRENFGRENLKNKYQVDSTVLLEPVFDVEKSVYEDLADQSNFNEKEVYILAYILDPTDEKLDILKKVNQYIKCKIITIPDGCYTIVGSSWDKYDRKEEFPNLQINLDARGFLKAFSEASFIITDSFHGTCFSIIFEKRFISLCNNRRGAERFDDILGRFGLLNRLVLNMSEFEWREEYLDYIDYAPINKQIAEGRKESVEWLKNAINVPVKNNKPITSCNITTTPKEGLISSETDINKNPEFIKLKILGSLLYAYGVRDVVLSPGGRDVPLVRLFENNEDFFNLYRVTDERSAGYFGMGIASKIRRPVVCVCTSGTAVSNYLPAVTEAYYTGVPLIMITADRMAIYHGQGEDQTIPQNEVFKHVTKKEITLPEGGGFRAEYQSRRDISDCILETTHNGFGPVHINFAIDNIGIGNKLSKEAWKITPNRYPCIKRVGLNSGKHKLNEWLYELKKSQRILIVYGQNAQLNPDAKSHIEAFASKFNCAIIADHISNLDCAYSLKPYRMLFSLSQEEFNRKLSPDILITVGGKRLMNDPLTFKVRGGLKNIRHWSVTSDGKIKDFYFRLTSVIEMNQDIFFEWFSKNAGESINNGVYYNEWKALEEKTKEPDVQEFNSNYVQSIFFPKIPENSLLHLGVGQSFIECRKYWINSTVEVYCNMGTNGIDGCTSTFMGQCAVSQGKLCFLIVGDLSFFYDMNSIWNKQLGPNVRILLVNNNGSGLLRNNNLKAITSVHNTSAKGWVQSTGFQYMEAHTKEEFLEKINTFMSVDVKQPLFFEVFCD